MAVARVPAAEDSHLIPVDRPVKAGLVQNMLLEGDSSIRSMIRANGEAVEDTKEVWTAMLEGQREVLAVAPDGDPSAVKFTVKKFTRTSEGKTTEPLKAGSVIEGKHAGGESTFTVDGEAAGKELAEVFKGLLSLSDPDDKTTGDENKAFGADKPRKVGEQWDVDGKEMAAIMPDDMPFLFDHDKTTGKLKLVEISVKDGVKCGLIQGEVTMQISGMKGLPAGFKADRAFLTVALDGLFPLDATLQPLREGTNMSFDFSGGMANGGGNTEMKMSGRFLLQQKVLP